MPLSAILQLEAVTGGIIEGFTGRGVHGFWHERWKALDPVISDGLHQQQEQSFTLSPLMELPVHNSGARLEAAGKAPASRLMIEPGQKCWLRLVCLSETLAASFLEKWAVDLDGCRIEIPKTRQVGDRSIPGVVWKVMKGVMVDPLIDPLSGMVSYGELAQHLENGHPPEEWNLEFLTPTTFNSGRTPAGRDNHLPFPLPDSLIKSWLRRWNAFAPFALPEEELLAWARASLAVSAYSLRTMPVREGGHLRVGCAGRFTLRALDMPPELRAAVDLLVSYSFYCGSGSHTAQGMGQTFTTSKK